MSLFVSTLQWGIKKYSQRSYQELILDCENPGRAQERTLEKILQTTIGLRNAKKEDFIRSLPEPKSWGESGFFQTKEKVRFFEKTSGSTAALGNMLDRETRFSTNKRVPYTKSLLKHFEKMFLISCYDIFSNLKSPLEFGKIFLSISPKCGVSENNSRAINDSVLINTNLDDSNLQDDQYLNRFLNFFLKKFLVIPTNMTESNEQLFFDKLIEKLAKEKSLEIISIWSPSYLLALMDMILERGSREDLRRVLRSRSSNGELQEFFQRKWPKLKIISCWSDGSSKSDYIYLKEVFFSVSFFSKGLMATEGVVSVPLVCAGGSVPFLNGTFIEGIDPSGNILGVEQWKEGEQYDILITTFGGLRRYRLGDKVQVTHLFKKAPVIQFIGRVTEYCDMTGEKLHSSDILNLRERLQCSSLIFAPHESIDEGRRYLAFLESSEVMSYDDEELAKSIETILSGHHHYNLSRFQKQLERVKIVRVKNLRKSCERYLSAKGQPIGQQKSKLLLNSFEETKDFISFTGDT